MRPNGIKKDRVASNGHKRSIQECRLKKQARTRDSYGVVEEKKTLQASFLNVDGLSEATLEDIKNTVQLKTPDLVFWLRLKGD